MNWLLALMVFSVWLACYTELLVRDHVLTRIWAMIGLFFFIAMLISQVINP